MTGAGARGHLGRRGVPLTLLGAGQVCWGAGYLGAQPDTQRGLRYLLDVAPLGVWAVAWMGAGAVALGAAWLPVGRDRWGFVAALMMPLTWALGHVWAAVGGYARGWFVAAAWLFSHALLVMWAASVAEYTLPRYKCRSRRAPALALLGVGQICWGVGYAAAPGAPTRGLEGLLALMPLHCWAVVWILSGVFTLACSRLPVGRDRWRFAGAAGLPLVWGASYGWEWISDGYGRGGVVLVWYLCMYVGMALWAASVPHFELPGFPQEGRV